MIHKAGINLIKHFEGFKPKMYLCPAGLPTIGYGTVIDTKEEEYLRTATLTEQDAERLLAKELEFFEKQVDKMVLKPLKDYQRAALVSFAFNCGPANLRNSTLLRKVNINPNDLTIRDEFMKWTRAGGRVLRGLVTRRQAEADLYFSIK